MTTYRYRPSRFGNKLVLQHRPPLFSKGGLSTVAEVQQGHSDWRDANLQDLPVCNIQPTEAHRDGMRGAMHWRLRPGWFGRLVLQWSERGSDFTWNDARLQDLSMSQTPPVPGSTP